MDLSQLFRGEGEERIKDCSSWCLESRNYPMPRVNVKNISIASRRITWNYFSPSIPGFVINSSTYVVCLRRKDTPIYLGVGFRSMPPIWLKPSTKRFSILVPIHDWISTTSSKNSLPPPSPNGSLVSFVDEKRKAGSSFLLLTGAQATAASYKQWKIRGDSSILASDHVLEQTSSPADSECLNQV